MAITITGKNYTQHSSCDLLTSGGTWAGKIDTVDSIDYKEGVASLTGTFKDTGLNTATFTPTAAIDLSGTKHVRFWFLCSSPGLLTAKAAAGIRFGLTDGTNTGYWNVGGVDTYPGGWVSYVVDVSSAVDSGTKPTNMNAITICYFETTQTGTGKNVDNVWLDNFSVCDGLIAYGDDGDYFDLEDIYQADLTTLGIGILSKRGGVYFSAGSIEIGDSAGINGCMFQAKSQVLVFEDRPVNADLYSFDIVDNGTGTTEFIVGDKSGTVGVQGCTIRVADETQTAKFDVDGITDTDVDNFKMYGTSFFGADDIEFPANTANVEVISCNFEYCDQVKPDTATVSNCFFINTTNSGGALLLNTTSHNVSDSTFISDDTGHGVYITASGTYTFDNLQFISYGATGTNDAAIYNNSGGAVIIGATNGSSGLTYKNGSGATTTVNNAVSLDLKIITELGADIQDAWCYIEDSSQVEIMNEQSTATGEATETYNFVSDESAIVRVRKYGYKQNKSNQTIKSTGLSLTITLIVDPQQV